MDVVRDGLVMTVPAAWRVMNGWGEGQESDGE